MAADAVRLEPDGYEVAADDPLRGAHERLGDYIRDARAGDGRYSYSFDPKSLPAGEMIFRLPREEQVEVVLAIIARWNWLRDARHRRPAADAKVRFERAQTDFKEATELSGGEFSETKRLRRVSFEAAEHYDRDWRNPMYAVGTLFDRLLRRALPLSKAQFAVVADEIARPREGHVYHGTGNLAQVETPILGFARQAAAFEKRGELTGPAGDAARRVAARWRDEWSGGKYVEKIDRLLGAEAPGFALTPGEPWAEQVDADVAATPPAGAAAWTALLTHAATAAAAKPSKSWLETAGPLRDAVGDSFGEAVARWFPLVDKPRTDDPPMDGEWWARTHPWTLSDRNADLLKGLVWCCGLTEDRDAARTLTRLAQSSYKKVPGVGPRLTKVGNACVWALGHMPGTNAVGQLALLAVKVKFGTAQKQIDKALTAAADREGLPRDEIEELAVPTYGLTKVGVREETLGDFTARITVAGTGSAKLSFIDAKAKVRKSIPAAVKRDFPDELKDLKAAAKDVQKMLPAQRDRIDSLFLARKSWPLATWRERYWDHPLVGTLARRLIWRFGSGSSPQADGSAVAVDDPTIVDAAGNPIDIPDDATVTLWHPIEEPEDAVLAWRRFFEDRGISQPFKQAHREIYVLTDAERNTGVYSNRFAAQLVKQHQFKALGDARGWKGQLRLLVDDDYPPPSKRLPAFGLRAEYWVEGAGEEYGRDTNETGTFLHLATDQIRFYPVDAETVYAHASGGGYGAGYRQAEPDPVPLEEVPPLALSEVLRNADLFVGVAGVGNDPTWADGATVGENRYDRWHDYSFGDLSATAATRRGVLQRLVPRLKIADRCEVGEKFLRVRGEFRTYKIHLGSGNILMEPNDQYLCIVPKASFGKDAAHVALPFEGDRTLSVILSKAFLLADDLKIKDPTIVSQIER